MATKNETIEIRNCEMVTTVISIVGKSPLIVHKWSEKARRELLKESTSILKKKVARNPWAEAAATMWYMNPDESPFPRCQTDAEFEAWMKKYSDYTEEDFYNDLKDVRFGFPASAIKKAALNAMFREKYAKNKVSLQGLFFVEGEGEDQLVEIQHGSIKVREDNVKVGMGTADIRYRAQFIDWKMDLTITYDKNGEYTIGQIANMINLGGIKNGIGEWRIEKGGQYGSFRVE